MTPPKRRRVWTEAEVSDGLTERYQTLLTSLFDLSMKDAKKRSPHVLGLSGPAKRLRVNFYNEWGHAQHGAEGEQAAAFAKLEAYASRLMLLHHVVATSLPGADDLAAITEASPGRYRADPLVRCRNLPHLRQARNSEEEHQNSSTGGVDCGPRGPPDRASAPEGQFPPLAVQRPSGNSPATIGERALGCWEEAPAPGLRGGTRSAASSFTLRLPTLPNSPRRRAAS